MLMERFPLDLNGIASNPAPPKRPSPDANTGTDPSVSCSNLPEKAKSPWLSYELRPKTDKGKFQRTKKESSNARRHKLL